MIQGKDLSVVDTLPVKEGGLKEFLDAATVWINKPHVANKRLSGTKIVRITSAESLKTANEIVTQFLPDSVQDSASEFCKACSLEADLKGNEENIVIIFRQLLPKQSKIFPVLLEAVVYDQSCQSVAFLPLCYTARPDSEESVIDVGSVSSEVAYCFTFLQQSDQEKSIQLSCRAPENQHQHKTSGEDNVKERPHAHATVHWLRDTLAPKLQRWMEQPALSTSIKSLKLVGVDRYSSLYSHLKDKYGPELVKNWTESTDPQKFVYEDIGIAAYLLLIWEEDRQRMGSCQKQSFVDLGCGNGLLVYILTREGHTGIGFDIRKRKIWDSFGSDVNLQVKTIAPSADNLFPEIDWIIGNHSDELTPWIPVIAARSSYSCSYFVLPCCLHDFNCKFQSKVKGESSYQSYLRYVGQVGQACGFQVEEDTLRIPSTKRVCHIGRHRTYPQEQESMADQQRQAFIDQRCALNAARKPTSDPVSEQLHTTTTSYASLLLARKRSHHNDDDSCSAHDDEDDDDDDSDDGGSEDRDNKDKSRDRENDTSNVNVDRDTDKDKSTDKLDRDTDMKDNGGKEDGGETDKNENGKTGKKSGAWTEGFQARSSKERVRNCQSLSQETKSRVVQAVFEAVMAADNASQVEGQEGRQWRRGGSVHLSTVADMLDTATREALKSECGGVQTLLRNHSNVFQVSGGRVQLRDFSQADPWSPHSRSRKARRADPSDLSTWKIGLCWFHHNHPDGCPRTSSNCSFAHGHHELRPRPAKARR